MSNPVKTEAFLTIGELSRRSGVTVSAIHFYESKNLVRSTRNNGNHRIFARRELRMLALIKVAQRLGFTLEDIQYAFRDLPHDKVPSKRDWQKITNAWMQALQERIELAIKVRDQLTTCIGCGCLSLDDCPLRNPQDISAEFGPGPRFF